MPVNEPLPVVDMGSLTGGGRDAFFDVGAQIGRAARGVGFFYLTGHGIPSALVSEVFRQSACFFSLDATEKERQAITFSPHNRGYVALKAESLDPTHPGDFKEAFN